MSCSKWSSELFKIIQMQIIVRKQLSDFSGIIMNNNEITNHSLFIAAKGPIYSVTTATVTFSLLKITCCCLWRYHVLMQNLICNFIRDSFSTGWLCRHWNVSSETKVQPKIDFSDWLQGVWFIRWSTVISNSWRNSKLKTPHNFLFLIFVLFWLCVQWNPTLQPPW